MTAEAFGRVLDGMMSINTSRLITIVVFLSHSQKVPFFEQLKERCNAGVELAYWVKAQSNPQPGDRLTSIVEEILIGYHNNKPDLPNTKRVSEFFNFKKIDPDNAAEVPPQLNVFEFERVTRFFCPSFGEKKALNVDQKPLAPGPGKRGCNWERLEGLLCRRVFVPAQEMLRSARVVKI